jgi:hypothetical protein
MPLEYDPDQPLDDDTRQRLLERNRWQEVEENDRKFGNAPAEPEIVRGDPKSGSSSESAPGSEDPINPEGDEADEETVKIAKERIANPNYFADSDDQRAESLENSEAINDEDDEPSEDPDDPDNRLKPELKAELTRRGISYPRRARKAELVELLRQDEERNSGKNE